MATNTRYEASIEPYDGYCSIKYPRLSFCAVGRKEKDMGLAKRERGLGEKRLKLPSAGEATQE